MHICIDDDEYYELMRTFNEAIAEINNTCQGEGEARTYTLTRSQILILCDVLDAMETEGCFDEPEDEEEDE